MSRINILFAAVVALLSFACNHTSYDIKSPDGNISATVYLKDSKIEYKLFLNDSLLIDESPLGIKLQDSAYDFTNITSIGATSYDSVNEVYTLTTGKRRICQNHANQLTIAAENKSGKAIKIIFRVYNDGVAYRYILSNDQESIVSDEISGFNIPKGSAAWAMGHVIDSEGFYSKRLVDTMNQNVYTLPLLIQTPSKKWILLHESDVMGKYCASYLHGIDSNGIFKINIHTPRLKFQWNNNLKKLEIPVDLKRTEVVAQANLCTPWRVVVTGNSLKSIVETTLIENLATPSVTTDLWWINAGVATFPWWGNNLANGDTVALKKYIDLAAEMNWKFIEFDVALIGSGGSAVENWKTTPWIPRIVKYAASKGISVYGWDERKNLDTPEKRAEIFSRYQGFGIKGIKIDFVNATDQEAMRFREACLQDALKYQLLVSFHGDYPPRGERRTYPNIATQEGVKGAEYYLFASDSDIPTPEHNCTLPFTRNVVGPMDYTPVAFSNPRRMTTYTHELAMSVVVESGWQCMCDKPEYYLRSPAKEFLEQLVSVWDETIFLDGYPGKFFCIARRSGNKWFVAGINAGPERTVSLKLDFLKEVAAGVKLYCDGDHARETCTVKEITCSPAENMEVTMTQNGGFAMIISN